MDRGEWLSLSCINTYLFSLGCSDPASDSNRRRNKGRFGGLFHEKPYRYARQLVMLGGSVTSKPTLTPYARWRQDLAEGKPLILHYPSLFLAFQTGTGNELCIR
jgi:hypothetical protein